MILWGIFQYYQYPETDTYSYGTTKIGISSLKNHSSCSNGVIIVKYDKILNTLTKYGFKLALQVIESKVSTDMKEKMIKFRIKFRLITPRNHL